jgi:hypothetical protein
MPRKKKEILEEIELRIAGATDLTDEEKQSAREKARVHVASARKEKAIEAYLAEAIKLEEAEYEPDQILEDFYVDLPPYAPFIKINNVMYFHGIVYEVAYHKARAMADIAWRAWNHEREFKEGKSAYDSNRRPLHLALSPHAPNGRVTTTQNMREG